MGGAARQAADDYVGSLRREGVVMSLTNGGLQHGGVLTHYAIRYDDSLPQSLGLDIAKDLYKHCEGDFALMKSWFGGIDLQFGYPLPVNIDIGSSGASWTLPPEIDLDTSTESPPISINAGAGATGTLVRYLLVSEVSEMFMFSQNGGWHEPDGFFQNSDEGSMGEGLSRFLGTQFLIAKGLGSAPPLGYAVSYLWINGPRQNYVDSNPDDTQPDAVTGCTTLFLYYLYRQLGYSIDNIVANSASTLAGVYQNLTGKSDGWTSFSNLVNQHFPPGRNYKLLSDNLFPVPDLSQFLGPDPIVFGYEDTSTQIVLDNVASAEVVIDLKSADTAVATVPKTITIAPGGISINVPITAKLYSASTAAKTTKVTASYAGKKLEVDVTIGPPALVGFTISPGSVKYGDKAVATLTLSRASKDGDVWVTVAGDPGFDGITKPIKIGKHHTSHTFHITPQINDPGVVVNDQIYATLGSISLMASLTIESSIVIGVLYSVTAPASMIAGETVFGSVNLQSAVPSDTKIGLTAVVPNSVSQSPPHQSLPSTLVSVPALVTVPAGHTSATFQIKAAKPIPPTAGPSVEILASASRANEKSVNISVQA
jgi:hypothetical protein